MATFKIERWSKGTDGSDVWTPIKSGLSREKAERLVAQAKVDMRTGLWRLRVVAEPAATAAAPERTRRPFDAMAQEQRTARAQQHAADYAIREHDGSLILEKASGDSYITSETTCSCEDFLHVAGPAGGCCKHQTIAGCWLLERGLSWADLAPERPASPREVTPTCPAEVAADDRFATERMPVRFESTAGVQFDRENGCRRCWLGIPVNGERLGSHCAPRAGAEERLAADCTRAMARLFA
jgi:hypothetical protein